MRPPAIAARPFELLHTNSTLPPNFWRAVLIRAVQSLKCASSVESNLRITVAQQGNQVADDYFRGQVSRDTGCGNARDRVRAGQ